MRLTVVPWAGECRAPVRVPVRASREPALVSRALRGLRRVPLTASYLGALLAVKVLTATLTAPERLRVLHWASTDVEHLSRVPARVLVASAFLIPGMPWLAWAVLLGLALGPLERRIGPARTLLVVATGHVVATLLTEVPVALATSSGWLPPDADQRIDVGVSYVFWTAVAALSVLLGRRWGRLLLLASAALLLGRLAAEPDLTGTGHVLCLVLGVGYRPLLHRWAAARSTGGPSRATLTR